MKQATKTLVFLILITMATLAAGVYSNFLVVKAAGSVSMELLP